MGCQCTSVCEDCERWTHAACLDLGDSIYTELDQSDNIWFCPDFGLPNHSDLINDMYSVPVHNPFEALEHNITLEDRTELDSTLDSDTSLLIPQSASTPVQHSEAPQPSRKARKLSRRTLKIVNINCQSIVAHRNRIEVLIDSVRPDVLGTETWLDPSVTTPSELSAYNVERLNRNRHGGGVFVTVEADNIMSREYDLEVSDCELLWCKINLAGSKTLHVGSYYRPNVADNASLDLLDQSLDWIVSSHSVILGGDFNIPDWDWTVPSLKPGCNYVTNHKRLTDIMEDHGLSQHVTYPTRGDNTLDLLLTNRPNSTIQSQVIPGIFNHDVPLVEVDIRPLRSVKKPRDIPCFNSASWDEFRDYITAKGQEITSAPPDANVDSLWCSIRDALVDGTQKFITHKQTREKIDLPYITPTLRRLIRGRDRLHDKMQKQRRNISNHDRAAATKTKYKHLKAHVQSEIICAYWSYTEQVILPLEDKRKPSKSFWSFVR